MLVSYSENPQVRTILPLNIEAFIIYNHDYLRDCNLTQRPNEYLVIDFDTSAMEPAVSPQTRSVAP